MQICKLAGLWWFLENFIMGLEWLLGRLAAIPTGRFSARPPRPENGRKGLATVASVVEPRGTKQGLKRWSSRSIFQANFGTKRKHVWHVLHMKLYTGSRFLAFVLQTGPRNSGNRAGAFNGDVVSLSKIVATHAKTWYRADAVDLFGEDTCTRYLSIFDHGRH